MSGKMSVDDDDSGRPKIQADTEFVSAKLDTSEKTATVWPTMRNVYRTTCTEVAQVNVSHVNGLKVAERIVEDSLKDPEVESVDIVTGYDYSEDQIRDAISTFGPNATTALKEGKMPVQFSDPRAMKLGMSQTMSEFYARMEKDLLDRLRGGFYGLS